MSGWIGGVEAHEFAVHAQAVDDAASLRVESAEQTNDLGIAGAPLMDGFEELNFKLRIVFGGTEHVIFYDGVGSDRSIERRCTGRLLAGVGQWV